MSGLSYGLLSCKALLRRGLKVVLENEACKIYHKNGDLVVESDPSPSRLFFLNILNDVEESSIHDSALVATPSFDVIHKRLAHPGKDALEQMIRNGSVLGLNNIQGSANDMDCVACIQGKMTRASFQSGHEVAPTRLGRIHSDLCGPMEVTSLGKSRYFCMLIDDKSRYIWFHPCASKSDSTPWLIQMDKLFRNQFESHIKILRSYPIHQSRTASPNERTERFLTRADDHER